MKTIIDCVLSVPDPRKGNHKKHALCDMLFASLVSVMCGYDSYVAFALFTEHNLEWIRSLGFAFENGVPSHDAFRYAFSVVDHGIFSACLRNVAGAIRDKAKRGNVAIDGKALRRGKMRGGRTPFPSMCKCANGQAGIGQRSAPAPMRWRWKLVLADGRLQIFTLAHSKESAAGAGCQKTIMRQIVRDCKANAVLALKDNQKTLHDEMLLLFDKEREASPHLFAKHETPVEKNSGRIEKRTCWQTDYVGWFENIDEWYGLRSVIMVEAERKSPQCASLQVCKRAAADGRHQHQLHPSLVLETGAEDLHICTLAHSKESPAGAGANEARASQPGGNQKNGSVADPALGDAARMRNQERDDVRVFFREREA